MKVVAVASLLLLAACEDHAPREPIGGARAALDPTPNGVWERRDTGALSVMDHARLVYDEGLSRVLLVSSRPNRGTWAWDGTGWTQIAEPTSPYYMEGVAYDGARGVVVRFGGLAADFVGADVSNATSLFDGTEWTTLAGSGPSERGGATMAFDAARGRVVLTGGAEHTNGPVATDTWLFDGTAWTEATPPESPGSQYAGAAYDAARAVVVLARPVDATASETWEWDGTSWTRIDASAALPYAYQYGLAYDADLARVVAIAAGRLYAWDGGTWSPIGGADGRESERGNASLAYDQARSRLVALRGGSRTWEHDGTAWHELLPARPLARHGAAMAYDGARRTVVVFGGYLDAASDETWEWDGERWSRGPAAGPPAAYDVEMAYDSARERHVVVVESETWEYDGAAWRSAGPAPGPVGLMAYDAARGVTVGIVNGTETWTWDGASWRDSMATGPTMVRDSAMAYDAARERIVRFGGYTDGGGSSQIDETWEWDGASWMLAAPAASPSPRGGHAMAFDSRRGRIVVYGGYRHTELWEYDGTTWTMREGSGPEGAFPSGLAYDSSRDRLVFYAADGTLWEHYAVGDPCATGDDCPSGYCVDGVCCDRACTSSCEVCSIEAGGSDDGICVVLADAGASCVSSDVDAAIDGARLDGGPGAGGSRERDGGCCSVMGDRRSPAHAIAAGVALALLAAARRARRRRR